MNFYHCTTTESGRSLLRSKKKPHNRFRPSSFDYKACIDHWLNEMVKRPVEDFHGGSEPYSFPRTYFHGGDNREVVWLGNGIYCFSEAHKQEAPLYAMKRSDNLDAILEIHYEDEYTHLDMNKEKDKLISFLQGPYLSIIEQLEGDSEILAFMEVMIELLVIEIERDYYYNPHAAAVVLELYLDLLNIEYDVVSNKFSLSTTSKQFDNYSAIRNLNLINDIAIAVHLSRELKVAMESNRAIKGIND